MNRRDSNFARVYDEHVGRVYGFVAYRVENRHTAEDLTQATFERALRAWSRFDPRRGSESTWLLAIARNVCIDHFRRDRSGRLEPLDDHVGPVSPGPEERYAARYEIAGALASLGDRDQEVVALRFGGDLTGPEIASLMDLRLANVQQILSRSLRKLRELLEVETPTRQGRS
jgi:RNA polymerase sigma-70 factor (ECF subfamily)